MSVQVEALENRELLTALMFDGDDHHDGAFYDEYGDLTWAEGDLAIESDALLSGGNTGTAQEGVISGNDDMSDVNDGTFDLSKTFSLQSNAGSNFTIYLDFNGHTTSGTFWNSGFNSGNDIITQAWSLDGDRSSFSTAEQQAIQRIWSSVAEDFAPFDVNVTTMDPGTEALRNSGGGDTQWGVRVVIGPNSFYSPAGGVAYVGSFDWSTDTPAFVFNTSEVGVREAISHEVGHTLGLYHDGTSSTGYYSGHGSGETSWSPIMGVGYYTNVSQWSKGEYTGANNTQDDLAIITTTNGFGYRADDIGNSTGTATSLTTSGTSISGQGLIERNTDIDYFSFTTGTGAVSIDIDNAVYGANLDILAKLYDSSGTLIATSNPSGDMDATFNLNLSAGTYYISIDGTGEGTTATGYSDYGSLGNYWISGTVAAVAPNQNPVANNDSATTNEDNSVLINVMGNDSDPENNTLTITGTSSASNGTVTIVNGQIRYTPNANFFGTDTFTYTISDGNGGTATATVTVTVNAVPETSTVTGPASSTTDNTPTITWNNQTDAVRYEVVVYRVSTGSMVASNNNVTGTSWTVSSQLATGDYKVYVRAVNAGGIAGEWGMRNFTINALTAGNVTVTGPSGSTSDTTPTITWNAATNADHYEVVIYRVSTGAMVASNNNVSGTSWTVSSNMMADNYQVYVRAVTAGGQTGSWGMRTFTVTATTPGSISFTGPIGSTNDSTPTISWNAASNADHYEILIYSKTRGSLIVNNNNVGGTSFTPSSAMQDDSYVVYVRAVSSSGTPGYWNSHQFQVSATITPGNVTITGPASSTNDTTPTISWNAASNADHYEILVYSATRGSLIASSNNVNGTSFTPSSAWANDSYRVYVRAVSNTNTSGNWTSHSFVISNVVVPGNVTITGPASSTNDTTPTITWNAASNADHYQILVYSATRGAQIASNYNVSGTSFTPSSAWSNDNYRVYVRAVSSTNTNGSWSSYSFTIGSTIIPGSVTVTGPAGSTSDNTPTITWNAANGAATYQVLVYSLSRGQLVASVTTSATSTTINSALSSDSYRIYIRGLNSNSQAGSWSAYDFSIVAATPIAESEFLDMFWELSANQEDSETAETLWTV
ncbi:MAG: hypothetical protein Tsb009_14210 [Planctomycetaceae bacterium]